MAVALKANALITAVELDQFLRITIGDADTSNTLINTASDFIDRFANRSFIKATYTAEEYDGDGQNNIYLKNYPIVTGTVTVVLYDTYTAAILQTYTLNVDYLIYLKEGYIYMRGKTAPGHKNYRVTYDAGYLIADIPYDLKNACAQLAGLVYNNSGTSGAKSETIGKYSIAYEKSDVSINSIPVPADIAGVIAQYRRFNV